MMSANEVFMLSSNFAAALLELQTANVGLIIRAIYTAVSTKSATVIIKFPQVSEMCTRER